MSEEENVITRFIRLAIEHGDQHGWPAAKQALENLLGTSDIAALEKQTKPAAKVAVTMGRPGELAPHCVILEDDYEAFLDHQPFGTVHKLYKGPDLDVINAAYKSGWCNSARWANRTDLICDTDSPAYKRDRDKALENL